MKKLLCVLLMIMMVSFTGCTPKESVEEVYQTALENLKQSDSATITVNMNMQVTMYGPTMDVLATMILENGDMQNPENPEMHILKHKEYVQLSEVEDSEVWVKDGNSYIDENGERSVVPYEATSDIDIYELDLEGLIKGGTVEDDGTFKHLTIEINEDAYADVAAIVFAPGTVSGVDIKNAELDVSKCEITAILDEDNNFISMDMKIDFILKRDNDEAELIADVKVDYDNLNNTRVNFPDLSNFANEPTNGEFAGFTGEGKVCAFESTDDTGAVTYNSYTLYTDENNMVNGVEVVYKFDVTGLSDANKEMLKESMDAQIAEMYSENGTYISSVVEGDEYIVTIDLTDMSVADSGSYANKTLEEVVELLEAQGFPCK